MKRFSLYIGLLFLFSSSTSFELPNIADKPRNVLFIIVDDLSTTLSCYGEEGVITPNLDQLANRGVKFERAYCQASLCNPSRASIMTGRRPDNLRILSNEPHFRGVHPNIVTLPEHFKTNGYHTVGIGKIFHNWGQKLQGDPQSWSEPETNHWAAHYTDWHIKGRPYQIHSDIKKGPAVQNADVPDEAYLDGRIANSAVNKLRQLKETPFFMAVGLWKPHLPYNAPKKYWDLYNRNTLPEIRYPQPINGVPDLAYVDSNEARSYTDVPKQGELSLDKKLELRHGYLAAISYMDAQVGKILDELDRLDLTNKTTVVFLSDHGYHAGEHGQYGKWTNFEVGTRVPLIISSPKTKHLSNVTNSIVELVDLFPTLIDLHRLPKPKEYEKLDGVSIEPILKNTNHSVKSFAISQISRPLGSGENFDIVGSTIRDKDHRYTKWTNRNGNEILGEEFYDLSSDIMKIENQINNPKFSQSKQELNQKLTDILKQK